jgi:hypothetical protein
MHDKRIPRGSHAGVDVMQVRAEEALGMTGQIRHRIVTAVVEVHQTRGPGQTMRSAIAERAGAQQLTVDRPFPDAKALLPDCTSHWYAESPAPGLTGYASVAAHSIGCCWHSYTSMPSSGMGNRGSPAAPGT